MTPTTATLVQIIDCGGSFEIKGGPFATAEEALAAQVDDLNQPQVPEEPWAKDPKTGLWEVRRGDPGAVSPPDLPRSARLIAQVGTRFVPKQIYRERFYLSSNVGRSLWLLWWRHYDGRNRRWGPAFVVAHMKKAGVADSDAARTLLRWYWWQEEDGARITEVTRARLLSADEVHALSEAAFPTQDTESQRNFIEQGE